METFYMAAKSCCEIEVIVKRPFHRDQVINLNVFTIHEKVQGMSS